MPEQNVTELRTVGKTFVAGAVSVSDGLDLQDIGAANNIGIALMQAADDIKVDLETALEEMASEILREVARIRREKKGIVAVE